MVYEAGKWRASSVRPETNANAEELGRKHHRHVANAIFFSAIVNRDFLMSRVSSLETVSRRGPRVAPPPPPTLTEFSDLVTIPSSAERVTSQYPTRTKVFHVKRGESTLSYITMA